MSLECKRLFKFDPNQSIPIVFAKIQGRTRRRPVRLVFDTGAFMTQLSTSVTEELGYSARDGINSIVCSRPSGKLDEGYSLRLDKLEIFGKTFSNLLVATYDFTNLEKVGIDGLLGFDIIKTLHIEMNGQKGELLVFGE